MAVVAMAKDRTNKDKDAPKAKVEYTTFRLYADDGENLSDLAGLRGVTIAELFRDLFGAAVKKLLIAETKQRLEKLEGRA